jgi:hypothetical protein
VLARQALDGAINVTVSPDGINLYVASLAGAALAVFDRNATTREITLKAGQCVSEP